MNSLHFFQDFLKSTISPIALISGVGLILLSVTNRLGRTIDRARYFVNRFQDNPKSKDEKSIKQLQILYKRSKLLRSSIIAISLSILFSSLLIPSLLLINLYKLNFNQLCIILFTLSAISIICSAFFLVCDVSLTLKALDYQVKEYLDK